MPTICLCMMVKNEAHIIKRSLLSVIDFIDYYYIHDTGSTDNTIEIIDDFFKNFDVLGEIINTDWKDFGSNRTNLIRGAKGKSDYLLLVDADYIINIYNVDFKNNLVEDGYHLRWEGSLDYKNLKLIKSDLNWYYKGRTHEYLTCDIPINKVYLPDISITELYDGGNRNDKFERDIMLLKKDLAEFPNDSERWLFYLARSYECLYDWKNALFYYKKRIDKGGWDEEVYYSMYKSGVCKINLNHSFDSICDTLLEAFEYRPHRLEALYELIKYCRDNKKPNIGYNLGYRIVKIDYPDNYPNNDLLFVEKDVYTYKLKDEVSICAYWAGDYEEASTMCKELLSSELVPEIKKKRITKNLSYSTDKLKNHINNDKSKN